MGEGNYTVFDRDQILNIHRAKEREHVLEGLKLVCDHTDEVISIIRHSKDSNDSKVNLIARFGITDIQASAIVASPGHAGDAASTAPLGSIRVHQLAFQVAETIPRST